MQDANPCESNHKVHQKNRLSVGVLDMDLETYNISLFKTRKKKIKKETEKLSVACCALSFWTFPRGW